MKYTVIGEGSLAQAIRFAANCRSKETMENGNEDAQIAILCVSPGKMETLTNELLQKGMDVALPGWMAGDFECLQRLHQMSLRNGRKLLLLFPARYAPNVQDVQRVLNAGRLGRPGVLDYLNQWPKKASALLPLAEALDTIVGWLGEVETLRGFRAGADEVDCASLTARFANGTLLNLAAVCSPRETWKTIYEWSGSEGNLAYDSEEARSVRMTHESEMQRRFPLLGTQVCPLKAMLEDLPRVLNEHPCGAAEEDLRLASLIQKAFEWEGKEHA